MPMKHFISCQSTVKFRFFWEAYRLVLFTIKFKTLSSKNSSKILLGIKFLFRNSSILSSSDVHSGNSLFRSVLTQSRFGLSVCFFHLFGGPSGSSIFSALLQLLSSFRDGAKSIPYSLANCKSFLLHPHLLSFRL